MGLLSIKYKDGTSDSVENVFTVVDHGDGEISFFIGSGYTRYHAFEVETYEISEAANAAF